MKKRVGLSVSLLALSVVVPTLAYDYPLSTEAIRDAYFLGKRNDERSVAIFAEYTHHLPQPKTGPHISWIGVETPYVYIATHAAQFANNHAQEAEEEFLGKPQPFRVRIEIDFTATYTNPAQPNAFGTNVFWVPDFWKDFEIRLIQAHEIHAMSVRGGPIYSYYAADISGIIGAQVELTYDPDKVDSVPTKVEVITPDGQDVDTTFDLQRLR